MKRLLSVFCLFALLLTACGNSTADHSSAPEPVIPEPTETGIVDAPPWFKTFRVVDTMGETLLLAGSGDVAGDIYTMAASHCEEPVADGQLINVYFETVMETYPAQFGNISKVEPTKEPIDDRCGLYLLVLEDLWEKDSGLNSDVSRLGIDLSGVTDLAESEKSAIAYAFSCAHDLFPALTGTWDELVDEGYIDEKNLCWEDGIFFSLSGSAEEHFNAQKWRSGTGAYFFFNCTAEMTEDGSWSYDIGGQAIS